MDENKQPGIRIAQIFLAQVMFSHRDDVLTLPPNTTVEVQLTTEFAASISEEEKAGVVAMKITSVNDTDPVYRLVLDMVALLQIDEAAPNVSIREFASKMAPAMMYPFVREALANITGRGRFGPLWLAPLNIHAIVADAEWKAASGEEKAPE